MATYRQAKLAVHGFRFLASTIVTRSDPMSKGYFTTMPSSLASKLPGFSPSNSILHNPIIPQKTQLRTYHVGFVEWFPIEWFWFTPVTLWVGSKVFGYLSSKKHGSTVETVPYTKRRRLVGLSSKKEREAGERIFEQMKALGREGILRHLPATHPLSLRANVVSNNIIAALTRGLDLDENKGKHCSSVSHLVDLNWEVLVAEKSALRVKCFPGRKIVVCKGVLEHFESDAEIAVLIAREVGHLVARHDVEMSKEVSWVAFQASQQLVLYQFVSFGVDPYSAAVFVIYFMVLPSFRRTVLEADHIGLILMASAGYDPRVALAVYEKKRKICGGGSALSDYLGTRPSVKRRTETLATNTMEEAMATYRDVRSRHAKSR